MLCIGSRQTTKQKCHFKSLFNWKNAHISCNWFPANDGGRKTQLKMMKIAGQKVSPRIIDGEREKQLAQCPTYASGERSFSFWFLWLVVFLSGKWHQGAIRCLLLEFRCLFEGRLPLCWVSNFGYWKNIDRWKMIFYKFLGIFRASSSFQFFFTNSSFNKWPNDQATLASRRNIERERKSSLFHASTGCRSHYSLNRTNRKKRWI